MKESLSKLAAAGKKLRTNPETFEIHIGGLRGHVISVASEEVKIKGRRQVVAGGRLETMPERRELHSTLTVQWEVGTSVEALFEARTKLEKLRDQLTTQMEYGTLDMDNHYEDREV